MYGRKAISNKHVLNVLFTKGVYSFRRFNCSRDNDNWMVNDVTLQIRVFGSINMCQGLQLEVCDLVRYPP